MIKYSEFEIQATAYAKLVEKYGRMYVRGELTYSKSRFDLVILNTKQIIIAVIECKKPGKKVSKKQRQQYINMTNCKDIISCSEMWHAECIVELVEHYFKKYGIVYH